MRIKAKKHLEKITGGPMTLARAIKCERQCSEHTLPEFAKKLGISEDYLRTIEKDKVNVSIKEAQTFAKKLGESPKYYTMLVFRDLARKNKINYIAINLIEKSKKAA